MNANATPTLVGITTLGDRIAITKESWIAQVCDADNPHFLADQIFLAWDGALDIYDAMDETA